MLGASNKKIEENRTLLKSNFTWQVFLGKESMHIQTVHNKYRDYIVLTVNQNIKCIVYDNNIYRI